MIKKIEPGKRHGEVAVPPSKSFLHRYLIAAALSQNAKDICCDPQTFSEDVCATWCCLKTMAEKNEGLNQNIRFVSKNPDCDSKHIVTGTNKHQSSSSAQLMCKESGTTLRFLLPVAAALGLSADFILEGQLGQRPHDALIRVLSQHGAKIIQTPNHLHLSGKLSAGDYNIPGQISSQYISGLLFALPLLENDSILTVTGKQESANYIEMTEQVISRSGIMFEKAANLYRIPGRQHYTAPETIEIEGDWSAAAFFLCMGALSEKGILVNGLKTDSLQGDRGIIEILQNFGARVSIKDNEICVQKGHLMGQKIDASEIPDLVPALSVLAAGAKGTSRIFNAKRLRYKESDRLKSTTDLLTSIGADVTEKADGLIISGKDHLTGGSVPCAKDHRIAMAAALAACICHEPVMVQDAECVKKSYPKFWEDFDRLNC